MQSEAQEQPRQVGRQCAGCGATAAPVLPLKINGHQAGQTCHRCVARARLSARFRRQVELAALSGTTVPNMERIFACMGVFEVPVTAEECDAALQVPPGMTAATLGAA